MSGVERSAVAFGATSFGKNMVSRKPVTPAQQQGILERVSSLWLLPRKERSQHIAMGKFTFSFFLAGALLSTPVQAYAQNPPSPVQKGPTARQQAPYEIQLGPNVAESLLVHKEEPACQKDLDGVRVTGTVVIAVTIDKKGMVSHTRTLSGPKMLRPLALATVRKYRYKPYLLNNVPVEFETVVSIPIICIFHTGQA